MELACIKSASIVVHIIVLFLAGARCRTHFQPPSAEGANHASHPSFLRSVGRDATAPPSPPPGGMGWRGVEIHPELDWSLFFVGKKEALTCLGLDCADRSFCYAGWFLCCEPSNSHSFFASFSSIRPVCCGFDCRFHSFFPPFFFAANVVAAGQQRVF